VEIRKKATSGGKGGKKYCNPDETHNRDKMSQVASGRNGLSDKTTPLE